MGNRLLVKRHIKQSLKFWIRKEKKVRGLLKSRKAADIHKENMVIGGRFFYSSIEATVVTN